MITIKIIDRMNIATSELRSIVHEQQEIIEMVQSDVVEEFAERISEVEDELDIIDYNLRQVIETDDEELFEKGAGRQ